MSSPVTDILDPPQDPSPALQFGTFFVYCLVVVAHVEVESIKIALLGGRISFRNLRYVAENQSISVLQGHITFRYWKWAVRDESDVSDPTPLTDANASPSLGPPPNPTMCRIGVRVKGIEWCMYNRTPVFDWIEDHVHSSSLDPLNPTAGSQPSRPSSGPQQQQGQQPLQQQQQQQQPSGSSWFRDLFPIEFIAGKGCISIGNPSLPTVLILDWRKANGCYSIVPV
ncbi:hypothetical protein BCR44DRAFT_1461984 [Catenaria anguillulae PL171]|uniref:Uncharacterized protein n=1 Tax=Catenaria anguillulae PL171 TaxID=765915 RepID=A0A1Y2HI64_9FUNG|nr:hypothetical protein BCR44DRAFT_1461984 [Catenaria anguillulae PL171]